MKNKKRELPYAPPPHYIISEKECNKKPFNDWFEIFTSIFSLKTNLRVINNHANLIVKWINQQEDSYETRVSTHLLNELRYALKDVSQPENQDVILKLKDNIASFLPSEIYEPEFIKKMEDRKGSARQLNIRRAQISIEALIEEIETNSSKEIVQSFYTVAKYLEKINAES